MAYLEWSPRFETGVAAMDRQHRELVDMVNSLHEAMRTGRGAEQTQPILQGLVSYTRTHFHDEEQLQRRKVWPGHARHVDLHQDLLRQLAGFVEEFNQRQQVSTLNLADFLKNWLVNHILVEDMQYGPDLRD